jgi:hypothetical protein
VPSRSLKLPGNIKPSTSENANFIRIPEFSCQAFCAPGQFRAASVSTVQTHQFIATSLSDSFKENKLGMPLALLPDDFGSY